MKISIPNDMRPSLEISKPLRASMASPSPGGEGRGEGGLLNRKSQIANLKSLAGFTMMEIAISLAIIGIALVAIIGVLPIGMNVQQDNRQQTIVGQDANVFLEAIRNGSLGLDDLTNYVFSIVNDWGRYDTNGVLHVASNNIYTYSTFGIGAGYMDPFEPGGAQITNGANIIGLMSTPEYTTPDGQAVTGVFDGRGFQFVYSNHIVVSVHSISGLAVERPPQDNPIMQQGSFSYLIYCVNAPIAVNTNDYYPVYQPSMIEKQMASSLHDLRLTFLWPLQANGHVGSGRQSFRTLIAGQLGHQPTNNPANSFSTVWNNTNFYIYQSQWFTNAP